MQTADTTSLLEPADQTVADPRTSTVLVESQMSISPALALSRKLALLRRRHRRFIAGKGVAILIMVFLVITVSEMLLDWFIGFPMLIRQLLLLTELIGLGALFWLVLLRPILDSPDDEDLALAVERVNPRFRSRLISAIQLADPHTLQPGASRVIVERMIHQTSEIAEGLSFDNVLDSRWFLGLTGGAAASCAAFALVFIWGMPVTGQLLRRDFLSNIPVPHLTEVEVLSGSFTLARGDTAHLEAIARRLIPATGTVYVTYASGRRDVFPLVAQADSPQHIARFSFDVVNAQESFDYQLKLNDNRTAALHVDVQSAPVVKSMLFEQQYPKYLQLPDAPQQPGALRFVQGAKLKVSLTASSAMAPSNGSDSSHIHLFGSGQDVPIQVDSADPAKGSLIVPLPPETTGFAIYLVDRNRLRSKDPIVYPVNMLPDAPPTVSLVYPLSKEVTATHRARFLLGFAGHDDFGIDSLTLHFILDNGAEQAKSLEIKKGLSELRGRFEWDLSTIAPPAGKTDVLDSSIEYWLEAKDANNLTGPGIGTSEHYVLHIVTAARKRAELVQAEAEILGGIKQATDDQQSVAATLGDLVLEKK